MKPFNRFFTSKKQLLRTIDKLQAELAFTKKTKDEVISYNNQIADAYEDITKMFPLRLGEVVYEIQLRDSTGKYTKNKPNYGCSSIVEVVVTTKNYFKLVDKLKEGLISKSHGRAETNLKNSCFKALEKELS